MMGLRRLLREERELEEDVDHYKYRIEECDDDSLETLESAKSTEDRLLKVRRQIVNVMESNLERRQNWLRKHGRKKK